LSKDLQDATTSSTGEHTYYSTAPQELWTELLPKDLQDLNLVSMPQDNEGESSFLEVHEMRQSDLLLLQFLAEGGQANVYFAECEKFSTPVVVKRLKHGNVNLYELLCRMDKLMKIRKDNNSAICRVFGAGKDFVGNVWVVIERMAGDLRTLIDSRMRYLEDGHMPFDYSNTITMMLHIAQGMEDLHRCDLIHADLKASNILVTPVILSPTLTYFYVKIGDFETSDGVMGTRFWRAPEVLQALEKEVKPILSPAADVYSYGMLCYELLTGRIPFQGCGCSNKAQILKILSGQRPKLPGHVNLTMKELLRVCWHTEPRERPEWTWIIKTLKEELIGHPPGWQQPKRRAQPWERSGWKWIMKTLKEGLTLHPPGSQEPKRRSQPRIEMEREETQDAATTSETSNLVVTSWEEAAAQGLGTEAFATWKAKVAPEMEAILMVIFKRQKASRLDTCDTRMDKIKFRLTPAFFDEAWDLVEETWTNHVERGFHPGESGTDLIDGSEMETLEEGQIDAKRETERTVREIWLNEAREPYNLLGPTAENWLKEILATSKEWHAFLRILNVWHSEHEGFFQGWKDELQRASFAWQEVCVAFHACHVESPIAYVAWQTLENKKYREYMEYKVSWKCELDYYNWLFLVIL
jgi:serine/threonine protein kinase